MGHADRACYDLEVHSKKTKVPLIASQMLPEPQEVGGWVFGGGWVGGCVVFGWMKGGW